KRLPSCQSLTRYPALRRGKEMLQFLILLLLELNGLRLPLELQVLFLQFIEQHGSEQLIPNRGGLAVFVVSHHFGIELGHFLGDEAILQQVGAVVILRFVKEGHRTQLEQLAAAVAHVGDLLLEAARRGPASREDAGYSTYC